MIETIENQMDELKVIDSSSESSLSPFARARLLLLRSTVSSLSTLIKSNSQFVHPYIDRILNTVLPLHMVNKSIPTAANIFTSSEVESLCGDVDLCMDTICSLVPTRLLVPCIVKAASSQILFTTSHHTSSRFIQLLNDLWTNMDRVSVSNYSSNLCSLATLTLDYRRVYGEQTPDSDGVDDVAVAAVVSLCLKFTEVEVKLFLVRLVEWKDIDFKSSRNNEEDLESTTMEWQAISRDVTYFHLVYSLSTKLRSIFLPTMGVLWNSAVKSLSQFNDKLESTTSEMKKKRKNAELAVNTTSASGHRRVVVEMLERTKFILLAITTCAVNDNSHALIDEVRCASSCVG